jgi:hypothetical protein
MRYVSKNFHVSWYIASFASLMQYVKCITRVFNTYSRGLHVSWYARIFCRRIKIHHAYFFTYWNTSYVFSHVVKYVTRILLWMGAYCNTCLVVQYVRILLHSTYFHTWAQPDKLNVSSCVLQYACRNVLYTYLVSPCRIFTKCNNEIRISYL